MTETEILLNIKQLAQRLGVHWQTVRYWLRKGVCPIQPLVGMQPAKFRASDVEAFLNSPNKQAGK